MQSLLSAWSIYFWYLWRQETCLTDYQTILLTKWSFLYQEPMEQRAGSRVWPAAGLELRTTTSRCFINWEPLLVIKGKLFFPALEEPLVAFNNWFVGVFPLNPFFFLTCGKSDWGILVSVCSLFLPLEVAHVLMIGFLRRWCPSAALWVIQHGRWCFIPPLTQIPEQYCITEAHNWIWCLWTMVLS